MTEDKSTRYYNIDNIRAILIILVIAGHLYARVPFRSSQLQRIIIFSFHMPAFAFVSGLCFKRSENNKLFKNILYPYLVFQTLTQAVSSIETNGTLNILTFHYFSATWALWYLLSLFTWHLLLNVISFNKKSGAVILMLSIIAGLLAGFDDSIGSFLSLSRSIVYFPFFFGGAYIKQEYPEVIGKKLNFAIKILISVLAAVVILFLYMKRMDLTVNWLVNSSGYNDSGYNWKIRSFNYAAAAIMTAFLFVVVSNKSIPVISNIGKNSLTVYLLHIIVILYTPLTALLNAAGFKAVTVPLAAVCCAVVLSLKPVVMLSGPFMRWPVKGKNSSTVKKS